MTGGRSLFAPETPSYCSRCGTSHASRTTLAYRQCYSGYCTVKAGDTSSSTQPNIGTSSSATNSSAAAAVGLTQPAVAQPAQRRFRDSKYGFHRVRLNVEGNRVLDNKHWTYQCAFCNHREEHLSEARAHLQNVHPEEFRQLSSSATNSPSNTMRGQPPAYTDSEYGFHRVHGSSRKGSAGRLGYFGCGYCEVRKSRIDGIKKHLLEAHPEKYNRLLEYQAHSAR